MQIPARVLYSWDNPPSGGTYNPMVVRGLPMPSTLAKGIHPLKRTLLSVLVLSVVLAGPSCRSGPAKEGLFRGEGQHILPESRLVELTCRVTVRDIPEETKEVRLWVPFPVASRYQRLIEPSIQSPASYRPMVRYDARYGTAMLFVSAEAPLPKTFDVEYVLHVQRRRIDDAGMKPGPVEPDNVIRQHLAADLALPEDVSLPELTTIVADVAPPDNDTFSRAHAIYDYVMNTLEPDNTVFVRDTRAVEVTEGAAPFDPDVGTVVTTTGPTGRSVGEILSSRRGNAFDYALLTVVLMRSAGIPARIESGVLLGEDKTPDRTEVVGRHAWVRFHVPGLGWSVCDPYLAELYPELTAYLFRGACSNRVQLGAGPAPALDPEPASGAPTVLGDALAEADDKPVAVETHLFFRDAAGGPSR